MQVQAERKDAQGKKDIGEVTICTARLEVEDGARIAVTNLRGYLGHLFGSADTEFHHHDDNPYRYPLIQYKKLGKTLVVVGINDYAKTVQSRIPTLTHITLPTTKVRVTAVTLETKITPIAEVFAAYRFVTPWLALNSDNYAKYMSLDAKLRAGFLEGILEANVLSFLKGVGIRAPFRIRARLGPTRPTSVMCNGNRFMGLWGGFALNISLPEHIGVGKSVAKGFGAIAGESEAKK